MKKILIAVLICLILSSCRTGKAEVNEKITTEAVRGVWVSIYDMTFLKENEKIFAEKCDGMFKNIKEKNFNNVFVQVRPFSDALYNSSVFPWSSYLTGVQGRNPGFDPMKILIDTAHKYNLKFHAWINPYRILLENDLTKLSKNNPAFKMIKEKSDDVYLCDKGIFYNPSSLNSQKLILDGIREIIKSYNVDGIHIDDYFYPVTEKDIDENQFKKYKGALSLNEWRMMNVDSFISGMYGCVKAIDKNIIVSISPSGNIKSNYSSHYADVKKWLTQDGFADWIIPQIYFGFENEYSGFEETLQEWKTLNTNKNIKLIVGLAKYKEGKIDENAGRGKDEWIKHGDVISRQIETVKESGYVIFSYSYL